MVTFAVEADNSQGTKNEKAVAFVINRSLDAAGELILKICKNGQMITGENIENYAAEAIKKALKL